MGNRSRVYNTISLLMVTLSALVCAVVAIFGLSTLAAPAGSAATPTLFTFPSDTATLPSPTPEDTPTSTLRPTRIPQPTPTPLPTDTPAPGDTPESLAPPAALLGAPPGEPPLDLIPELPLAKEVPEVGLSVDLHYAERWARVKQTVHIRNNSPDPWQEVVFSIPLAALPDEFVLDSVSVGDPPAPVMPQLDGIMLRVPLPEPLPIGLLARITLTYRVGVPGVSIYSGFPHGNNGFSSGVMRLGEWYPVIAPYQAGVGWQTWRYQPVGDPTIYPAANTTLAVNAAPGVTVVSGGLYTKEGNVWRFRVDEARAMPILASDQFQEVEGSWRSVAIRCFTLGDNAVAAHGAIDIATDALSLYADLYGPYPFKSLDIVQNGYDGDMEYSALVSISNRGFRVVYSAPPLILHTLLAHEVAHQWWYGGVGNDQVHEPWLDEALASYSEVLYFDRYFTFKTNPRRVSFGIQDQGTTIDLTIYDYPTTTQYVDALYPRSAIFLDELRQQIGDVAFFAFLQDYQSRYRGKLATTHDFFSVLREHTQADLTPLLDAFFADPNR